MNIAVKIAGNTAGGSGSVPIEPADEAVAIAPTDELYLLQSDVVVSGAGTSTANGTYTYRGQVNELPYYNLDGQSDSVVNNVVADLGLTDPGQFSITGSDGTELYRQTTSGNATPFDAAFDSVVDGASPAPTVTQDENVKLVPFEVMTRSIAQLGSGTLFIDDLPTADPGVAGQAYTLAGVLMISAG